VLPFTFHPKIVSSLHQRERENQPYIFPFEDVNIIIGRGGGVSFLVRNIYPVTLLAMYLLAVVYSRNNIQ
jgi:hypothetical protein